MRRNTMKTKSTIGFALLLAMLGGSGFALADWVKVSGNDAVTGYADPDSIRKSENRVTMWALQDFKAPRPIGDKPGSAHRSQTAQFEYDCKDRRAKMLAVKFYSKNMAQGTLVEGDAAVAEKWVAVPPKSGTEKLWKIACGKR